MKLIIILLILIIAILIFIRINDKKTQEFLSNCTDDELDSLEDALNQDIYDDREFNRIHRKHKEMLDDERVYRSCKTGNYWLKVRNDE